MTFQTPITIRHALDHIHRHDYVLPAIQREFVWRPEQIARLFDSLMQGYPIGSFLFWSVERDNVRQYKFYDFVRDYHQRLRPHCPPVEVPVGQSVIAVLDGQQRLTALNIGLRGSHAIKEPRMWWNNPDAFPEKRLYINIAADADANEGGLAYDFCFLGEERAQHSDSCHWFPVRKILNLNDATEIFEYIQAAGLATNRHAFRTLNLLHAVVHDRPLIAFFEESSQDLDKVLNIFIRTNSGGTVLSYSDLLLSIATAQWNNLDARQEIHGLVDDLNTTRFGFSLSKDFVLKAGLMLADIGSVGFNVTNFNHDNMVVLERLWRDIARALKLTIQLVADFGFSGQTLGADNALLPIAYSLYKRGLDAHYLSSSTFREDREAIRGWLVRSLLKAGVWGSGLDTLLSAIRTSIREQGATSFPVEAVEATMLSRGKGLRFEQEELEDLVDVAYGDRRLFPLLSLLFPFHDLRHEFHVDHVFPRSRFSESRLAREGVEAEVRLEWIDRSDRLANLQLLDGVLNQEKSAALPYDWLASAFPEDDRRHAFIERHCLGSVPERFLGFSDFYQARRGVLLQRLRTLLGAPEAAASVASS
ncbi:MAG: DUF262 domain-containing protein [Aphanothece saxicola GSE-SYN-MK-01-06B]|jgi:hypothetical protein|nr:DUF262 domain-containing protein [Aphanothece saxicola GSE-SYN-MK-01-06B]